MRGGVYFAMAIGLAVSACAGRDPAPVASVQPQDVYSDCTMIRAEIEANNAKAKELADEQGQRQLRTWLPAWSVSLSGRFGLEWISRAPRQKTLRRCRPGRSISPRWQLNDARQGIGRHLLRTHIRLTLRRLLPQKVAEFVQVALPDRL